MAREFFKNLPSQETPFNSSRWNSILNGEESMGSIVVENITCKNLFSVDDFIKAGWWNEAYVNKIDNNSLTITAGNTQQWSNIPLSFSDKIEVGKIYTISSKGVPASLTTSNAEIISSRTENGVYIRTFKALEKGIKIKWLADSYPSVASDIQLENGQYTYFTKYKEFSNKQIYSTNEQVIGTWIDGKPLYRKVIRTTTASAINTIKTLDTIANLQEITKSNSSWRTTDGFKYLTDNPSEAPVIFVDTSNNVTESHKADYFNNATIVIVLEYTKTTD